VEQRYRQFNPKTQQSLPERSVMDSSGLIEIDVFLAEADTFR
jgi:hypothetical protein